MILDLRKNSMLDSSVYDSLKKISLNLKNEFNSIIGAVSESLSENLDWWVVKPASRNTLQSSLYYRFCCIHLVNKLVKSGVDIDKIIVDTSTFFSAISELKKKHGLNFEIEGPKDELPNFHHYMRRSIKLFQRSWKEKRFQFHAAKKTKHLSSKTPKIGLTLIDQFVFPGFITKDRYYNGLWDALTVEQKEKTFFVPTLVIMKKDDFENAYRELRTSERNFLIKEDYLTISDLLFSLLHIFRVWFIKPPSQEVVGINFSPLIREELLSRRGYDSELEGLLNYCFARRLKKKSFDLSLVIDWWEGQTIDRGWNLGFNVFFPEIVTKGYMGYVPRNMELQQYPSESDIKNQVAPKRISAIGEKICNEFKKVNSSIETEISPAFRFGHLWRNYPVKERSGSFKILMALSIMMDESVNILEQVIDSGLIGEENELEFMIKPHPAMKIERLKMQLGEKWSHNLNEVEGSTPEYIRMSDLLITGMSNVGLEAIALGVPVIVVETLSGLAFDPIPDSVSGELWRTCRSPDEISAAINYFMNRSPEEIIKHQKLSEQIKNNYFEPVTKEGVRKFLMLD